MTRIIKADSVSNEQAHPGNVFRLEEMAQRADHLLDRVRDDCARLVTQAREDAKTVRQEARQEGELAGTQAAMRLNEQQLRQSLETVQPALQKAVKTIQDSRQEWMNHWETQTVELAIAIARLVIRREVRHDTRITTELVREALELAGGQPHIRVRMNPDDVKTMEPVAGKMLRELDPLGAGELIADPDIEAGGCRVETEFGCIDQQFESQLDRIREELTN